MRGAVVGVLAVGAAATIASANTGPLARTAGTSSCHRGVPPVLHDGFPEPPTLYSRNGKLNVRLRAAVGQVRINHHGVVAWTYDGSYPAPTLVICAGDRLTLHLENELPEPTNLHTHGFHVSPEGNHDNVFLRINPGKHFKYEYDIPQDQAPGTYWYHPHLHMHVENQIFDGLAGAIVQEGGLDTLPALRKVPQRWMVLTDTQIKNGKVVPVGESNEPEAPWYVNGVINPTAKIRPGELQRWSIFNASSDRFVLLRLSGGQRFQVLSEDAHTLARLYGAREVLIGPGSRREVLVRGGGHGTYRLTAAPFAQFPGGQTAAGGGPVPNQTLITLRSSGRSENTSFSPETVLSHPVDLRRKHVDRKRTIVFSVMENGPTTTFLLNGMTFNPNRIDITMKLGSVERWTLVNTTTEWHTFHIHQNAFQVVSVAGKRTPFVDYQDNVVLPPKSRTVVLMQPTDFTGKFVFHCHVTFHEDHGMMATVQVVRKPTAAQSRASVVNAGGFAIGSSAYGSAAAPPAVHSLMFICGLLGLKPGHAQRVPGRPYLE
jgi:FtsP/CotA-like multicopper oxidase with cupredoxin domain